jgi:hypothetical protein
MKHIFPYYENIEFNVNDGASDYDVNTNQATFSSVFGAETVSGSYANRVSIRTNNTITVKLNSTGNHSITIASTDSPFVIEGVEITNMYISNSSGAIAAVKLMLTAYPF